MSLCGSVPDNIVLNLLFLKTSPESMGFICNLNKVQTFFSTMFEQEPGLTVNTSVCCWSINFNRLFLSISNILMLRQNGRHFPEDIFQCIFLTENVWLSIKIELKFVPRGPINNIPALVQIMGWRRPGDKPLFEPMMVSLLTDIYASINLNELIQKPQIEITNSFQLFSYAFC